MATIRSLQAQLAAHFLVIPSSGASTNSSMKPAGSDFNLWASFAYYYSDLFEPGVVTWGAPYSLAMSQFGSPLRTITLGLYKGLLYQAKHLFDENARYLINRS
jgi:hypothetical protein